MFTVLAAMSAMEREYIRYRTLEGHDSACKHLPEALVPRSTISRVSSVPATMMFALLQGHMVLRQLLASLEGAGSAGRPVQRAVARH